MAISKNKTKTFNVESEINIKEHLLGSQETARFKYQPGVLVKTYPYKKVDIFQTKVTNFQMRIHHHQTKVHNSQKYNITKRKYTTYKRKYPLSLGMYIFQNI